MSEFMLKDGKEKKLMQVFPIQKEFLLYFYFAMLSAYTEYKSLLS